MIGPRSRQATLAVALALALGACATADHATDAPTGVADAAATDAPIADASPIDGLVDAAPDACTPITELCNHADDDCDGMTDEDFPTLGTGCTAGTGACMATGVVVCGAAGGVECNAEPGPSGTEVCNSVDDDCDGMTDEGFGLGTACDGGDADLCAEGTVICDGVGGTTCSDATGTTPEVCNGADDDCDGMTDEDFGLGTACDGTDGDACIEGTVICDGAGGTTCSDATGTTVETCNSVDDDCDGATDEAYPVGQTCTVGVGACARTGQQVCTVDGTATVCNVSAGSPAAETCGDGIDQDCTGADVSCPVNDLPAGAINISAGGTFTVDLGAAHDDDASAAAGCGSTGGRDVFYTFTLPAPEVVYAATFGSSFDSVIRIYSGTCPARTGTPSCDDDAGVCAGLQSQLATQLGAGTYCLVVDQYSSTQTTGAMVLTFVRGGRPGALLATGSGTVSGTTAGGTNYSVAGCQSNSSSPDVGYYYLACPSTTMTLSANTCSASTAFDSILYVRQGSTTTGDLACNDDDATCAVSALHSRLTSVATPGPGLFWLVVDAYNGASGAYAVTYTLN